MEKSVYSKVIWLRKDAHSLPAPEQVFFFSCYVAIDKAEHDRALNMQLVHTEED